MKLNQKNDYYFNCKYQIMFCPKGSKKLLMGGVKEELGKVIEAECKKKEAVVVDMDVQPDYVYLYLDAPMDIAPLDIIKSIKHQSAIVLKKKFPELTTKTPCLWNRSALVCTAGFCSPRSMENFVESQKDI